MIAKTNFGKLSTGEEVSLYTITNKNGMSVSVCEYGAALVSVKIPDKHGNFDDVILGFDDVLGYASQKGSYMGAIVGRHANRIRNGRFILGNKTYDLFCNDGKNHLHGGKKGFDSKIWKSTSKNNSVIFTLISPDNDENYPGNLDVCVTYTLSDDNRLTIDYSAVCDTDTVVNLSNHAYFNLKGHSAGNATDMFLYINADLFTEIDNEVVPNGSVIACKDTPLDFRTEKRIRDRINENYPQLLFAGGYDHNFVLNKEERGTLSKAAVLYDENSGRFMELYTTMPGLQFYSGNFLDGSMTGKDGTVYEKHSGVCLETQYFPNAMENTHFPSPVLKKDEKYHHVTELAFGIK